MKDTETETNTQVKIARKKETSTNILCAYFGCACAYEHVLCPMFTHAIQTYAPYLVRLFTMSSYVCLCVAVCIPMPIHSSVSVCMRIEKISVPFVCFVYTYSIFKLLIG